MIRFKCPSCGKRLKVPDGTAGKKGICSRCGESVEVPGTVKGVGPDALVLDDVSSPDELAHRADPPVQPELHAPPADSQQDPRPVLKRRIWAKQPKEAVAETERQRFGLPPLTRQVLQWGTISVAVLTILWAVSFAVPERPRPMERPELERRAQELLDEAKRLHAAGQERQAIRAAESVINLYPQTRVADEAQRLADEWEGLVPPRPQLPPGGVRF